MNIDPYILAFSALTVIATIWMGFRSAKTSKTASDFFVAGRSVSVGWNASAISGEYLSAASFMGIAGMVMSSGYDALWYPVCYACGYLFLLLFIAGPLRRFGAYTIPDFAEGRYDSPLFRKIAVCFVLFIGFFYTMPQMKGAGVTLAYIFPGLPYQAGVLLVGAVITLNVALGGMKGITLVQAFQYWAKMFAISVPIFVLMAVYGNYGKQLAENSTATAPTTSSSRERFFPHTWRVSAINGNSNALFLRYNEAKATVSRIAGKPTLPAGNLDVFTALRSFAENHGHHRMLMAQSAPSFPQMTNPISITTISTLERWEQDVRAGLRSNGVDVIVTESALVVVPAGRVADYETAYHAQGSAAFFDPTEMNHKPLRENAPDSTWLSPFDQSAASSTNLIPVSTSMTVTAVNGWVTLKPPARLDRLEERVESLFGRGQTSFMTSNAKMIGVLLDYTRLAGRTLIAHTNVELTRMLGPYSLDRTNWNGTIAQVEAFLKKNGVMLLDERGVTLAVTSEMAAVRPAEQPVLVRKALPEKAPADSIWLSPFGPLTTKAAKAANALPRWNLSSENRATLRDFDGGQPQGSLAAMLEKVGRRTESLLDGGGRTNKPPPPSQFENWTSMPTNTSMGLPGGFPMLGMLREYGLLAGKPVMVATNLPRPKLILGGSFQSRAQFLQYLESLFLTNGVRLSLEGDQIKALAASDWETYQKTPERISFVPNDTFGMRLMNVELKLLVREYGELGAPEDHRVVLLATNLPAATVDFNPTYEPMFFFEARPRMEKMLAENGVTLIHAGPKEVWAVPTADLARYQLPPVNVRAMSLLYTYSLIIALVCGTAGLPHILVRFYTNPDGVAAKRTTMWVMILIGIFYVFPPVFGVMGRNLMPELYNGLTGVKGTDGIVLKLPTILREKYGVVGSILSGVTCAGAFAAFMSTFSGLLVSMTGALAHDVYGRILKPKSTPEQRLRMFKFAAVLIGGVAIVLGSFVEPLEINFMVGQAFAIAAASYFPLLFMSVWWRGMTMRGAAIGMLTGGLCALAAVTLTNVSNLALDKGPMGKIFAGFAPMNEFWGQHPLLRILCEQPAIWTVPLAIGLMIVMSKLTRKDVPSDARMKMLVLHAPEKLGLKQEYIQEHQPGH